MANQLTTATPTTLALRCGCVAPQSETITAVEGTDAHGDLITETHGNCPEHGWQRVDWTKDATYLDGDNRLLAVGNTVRLQMFDESERDAEADVQALWLHPKTCEPYCTITTSDRRLCTQDERSINCVSDLEVPCSDVYLVG